MSRKWYDAKVSDRAPKKDDDYFLSIEDMIAGFDNESSLMLCGFENGRPEIYTISNPGLLGSESAAGFAAIGVGQDTALNRLYTLETDPSDPLEKVLYDAFDAKEACSESLPEVGRDWDAFVVIDGPPPIKVGRDITDLIEQIYDSHPKSPFPNKERKPLPRGWHDKLRKWASEKLEIRESGGDGIAVVAE